jgi:hypothetical protein
VVAVWGVVAALAGVLDVGGEDTTAGAWWWRRGLCRRRGVRLSPVTPGTNWEASCALVVVVGAGPDVCTACVATGLAVVGAGVVPAVA